MSDLWEVLNSQGIVAIAENSWDALAEGSYIFTFSVSDDAGNVPVISVIIIKDLPSSSPELAIPFGNYYILFITLGIVSLLLIEYKKEKK